MKPAALILLLSVALCSATSEVVQPSIPAVCSVGEIWKDCATCEPTCADPNPICTTECRPAACQCAPGLVRHFGRCIEPSFCKVPTCPSGELWKDCATCEPTCADPNPICTLECRPAACQCAPGLVRHQGKCIQPAFCKGPNPRCGFNEVYNECGTMCEPYCNMFLGQIVTPLCNSACRAGCQCAPGNVRVSGVCLSQSICKRWYWF